MLFSSLLSTIQTSQARSVADDYPHCPGAYVNGVVCFRSLFGAIGVRLAGETSIRWLLPQGYGKYQVVIFP